MGKELKDFEDTKAVIQIFLNLNEVKTLIKEGHRTSRTSRTSRDYSNYGYNDPSLQKSRETIDNKFEEAKRIYVGLVEKYKTIPNIEISLLLLSLESLFLSIELFTEMLDRFREN